MAGPVEEVGMGVEVGAPLGLQRDRDHVARREPAQLVEIEIEGGGVPDHGRVGVVDYPEHGVLLRAGVTRRCEPDYSGGYATPLPAVLIHNIWSYLQARPGVPGPALRPPIGRYTGQRDVQARPGVPSDAPCGPSSHG